MEFDPKRFLKLAGIADNSAAEPISRPVTQPQLATRTLVESARRVPAASSDEQKLRALIRREAQKMISERASQATSPNIESLQQRKSLVEAITLGFAGIGFGSNRGVLGGPMTSASRLASLDEEAFTESPAGDLGTEGGDNKPGDNLEESEADTSDSGGDDY